MAFVQRGLMLSGIDTFGNITRIFREMDKNLGGNNFAQRGLPLPSELVHLSPFGVFDAIVMTIRLTGIVAGSSQSTHNLGRPPIGYLVVNSISTGAQFWSASVAITVTTGPPVGTATINKAWDSQFIAFTRGGGGNMTITIALF